jgi:hypothetical protein
VTAENGQDYMKLRDQGHVNTEITR